MDNEFGFADGFKDTSSDHGVVESRRWWDGACRILSWRQAHRPIVVLVPFETATYLLSFGVSHRLFVFRRATA